MRSTNLYITFLFFLTGAILWGQQPLSYSISDRQELPSNEVYQIVQDKFGYIWIGCDAGLFRYDGFTFKQYKSNNQNSRAFSFLQLDHHDRIWCKNFYGQIYRVQGDSLLLIHDFKTSSASEPRFSLDTNDHIFTYQNQYIVEYDEMGDSLNSTSYKMLSGYGPFENIYHTTKIIYTITRNGELCLINTANHQLIRHFPIMSSKPKITSINDFYRHRNKLYFFCETLNDERNYHLFEISDSIHLVYEFKKPIGNDRIYGLYSDGNNFWACTSFGAYIFWKNDSPLSSPEPIIFNQQKISYICKDHEDMYWFSTLYNGIHVIPNLDIKTIGQPDLGLPDNVITKIQPHTEKKVLMGTYLGEVYIYDLSSKEMIPVFTSNSEKFLSVKFIRNYLEYTIMSRGRLCIVNNKTGEQVFTQMSNMRDMEMINDTIYLLHGENLIKSSFDDLYNKRPGFIYIKGGGKEVEYDPTTQILYMSYQHGVDVVEKSGRRKPIDIPGFNLKAATLYFDQGIFWIGSLTDGLIGLQNQKIVYKINKDNLLDENSIRLIKASKEYLWIVTEKSLYRINKSSYSCRSFPQTSSIHAGDILDLSFINGYVYMATSKGVIYFPENRIENKNIVPQIKIQRISVDNKTISNDTVIRIQYDDKNLRIDFSSVVFSNKNGFIYKYKMEGIDNEWNEISPSTPYVIFPKITPGSYTFYVLSQSNAGISSEIRSISIFVTKPFWQKWWFYVAVSMVSILLVILLAHLRIRFIKQRAILSNKLIASQLTALKSQMNPHFLFNTLNSLQDLILKNDIRNTNYYLSKFSNLMRMVLDSSGKEEISLSEEIEMLDTYLQLEKLRFGTDFEFTIEVDEKIDQDHINLPPLVVQPFIENAIKHGLMHKKGNKTLRIIFEWKEQIICTITDNGVGRKKSREINQRQQKSHRSFATDATQKRIELLRSFHNNKFELRIIDLGTDEHPEGTRVTLIFPTE